MTRFFFDIDGACGPCCRGNLLAWIAVDKQIGGFTIQAIDLSSNYQQLIVDIVEEDLHLEKEVASYLEDALADSTYKLISKQSETPVNWHWLLAAVGLGIGIIFLIISLLWSTLSFPFMLLIACIAVPLTMVLGMESWRKAQTDLYRGEPGMDSLFVLSTLTAVVVSVLGLFIPGLPMMFEAGLLIFGFRHLGIAIKKSLFARLESQIQYQSLVSKNFFKRADCEEWISFENLQPGDLICVEAGSMLPLDGWLLAPEDATWTEGVFDVSMLEGSIMPKTFAVDDAVFAGMIAQQACRIKVGLGQPLCFGASHVDGSLPIDARDGQVWVVADTPFALTAADLTDSHGVDHSHAILNALSLNTLEQHLLLAAKQQLVRGVLNHAKTQGLTQTASQLREIDTERSRSVLLKAPIQNSTDAILHYFVPAILGLAIGTAVVLAFFFPWMVALQCMIALLISACPCTLGLIMSLVMELARRKAESVGVIFHDPAAIEALAQVDTVVFDLHKTLTVGKLTVHHVDYYFAQDEVNQYLALLERSSHHAVGQAIYATINGDTLLQNTHLHAENIRQEPDGVSTIIDGKEYLLGNCTMMARHDIKVDPGGIYLVVKDQDIQIMAKIVLQDALRPDAALAIAAFKEENLTVHLCTGADEASVKAYEAKLALNGKVYCDRSGLEQGGKLSKKALIQALQKEGHCVLMVGDGPNDKHALQEAHVSFVMTDKQNKKRQPQAQARIDNGEVMALVKARYIAKQAMYSIAQNLLLSLAYNLVAVSLSIFLLLGFGIVLHPGVGAALMVIQTVFIFWNVWRLDQQSLPEPSALAKNSLFPRAEGQDYYKWPSVMNFPLL